MPATLSRLPSIQPVQGENWRDSMSDYESAGPYDLDVHVVDNWLLDEPGAYRVTKMAYRRKGKGMDKTQIRYNAGITLAGIPDESPRVPTRGHALRWTG